MCVPVSLYSVSRINASAAGDRGVMTHLKGTGNLLQDKDQKISGRFAFIMMIVLTILIHLKTRVSPREYFPGRQRLVWWHKLREDGIQLSIRSCRLNVYQDIYWGIVSAFIGESVGSTDRRPNPNTAESGSLISGLSFPSFRYRSGWNTMGSLNTSGSCIIDLNNRFRRENEV